MSVASVSLYLEVKKFKGNKIRISRLCVYSIFTWLSFSLVILLILLLFFFLLFWDRVSLCNFWLSCILLCTPSWLCYHRDLHASVSRIMGLKTCTTTPSFPTYLSLYTFSFLSQAYIYFKHFINTLEVFLHLNLSLVYISIFFLAMSLLSVKQNW